MMLTRINLRCNHSVLKACSIPSIRNFSDEKKPGKTDEPKAANDDKPSKSEDVKATTDKLNKLLSMMQKDDNLSIVRNISMAKPGFGKKQRKEKMSFPREEGKPKDLLEAAKDVANLFESDDQKKKTESELLSKLLHHINDDEVGSEKPGLNNLLAGMNVDRTKQTEKQSSSSRGQYVRNTLDGMKQAYQEKSFKKGGSRFQKPYPKTAHPNTGSVNLFGGEGLNLFTDEVKNFKEGTDLCPTWNSLEKHELKMAVTHPPSNYFEQMILWTDQGKLWKFPINNEQGLEEEAKVDFSEHIFLEQHLENWCPTRGPIRHFMELVCVGLSKNPYISAQEKKDHILWYKKYFDEKKDILKDVIIDASQSKKSSQEQLA